MRPVIVLGFAFLLTSCASTMSNYYTQTVDSWRGASANQLVKQWGTPDLRMAGPNHTTFYVYRTEGYRHYNQRTSPPVGVNYAGGRPVIVIDQNTNPWNQGAMVLTCAAGFEANAQGIIVNTQVKGNGCYGGDAFAQKYRNNAIKQG